MRFPSLLIWNIKSRPHSVDHSLTILIDKCIHSFSTNRKNGLNVYFHHVCKTTYSQLLSHISSWRSSVDSETLHWAPVCLKEASASCKMTRLLLTRGKRFPSLLCLIKRSVLSIILKCLMPQAWCADQMNALEAQWRLCKRQELNNGSGKSCSALSACL